MKIQIPDNFMGKPIKGSIEKILADAPLPSKEVNAPSVAPVPATINNASDYIILPAATHGNYSYPEMLVAMEKTHHGKNWNDAHVALINEGNSMLSIRQFADFLNLLRSGNAYDGSGAAVNKGKIDSILDEIYTVRSPWRSEWLDAKFSIKDKTLGVFGGKACVSYNHKLVNGQLVAQRADEELEECLMEDKKPGINLEEWLSNATYQGLPKKDISDGNLWYWNPRNGAVAGFDVSSVGAGLGCGGDPSSSSASLGVRAVREKI